MHQWRSTQLLSSLLLSLLLTLASQEVQAGEGVREQEIAQCLPGEISTWGDGRDRPASSSPLVFVYEHAGAPVWFTQANLGLRLLAMSSAMFALLNTRNPAHDARQTLQMVISHEMGHHFGLMAHLRRCVDVTSYYDNGKGESCLTRDAAPRRAGVEYRALLPTACDIERCVRANNITRLAR